MRAIRRYSQTLFIATILASLLACSVITVLWIRSRSLGDGLIVSTLRKQYGGEAFSTRGIMSTDDGLTVHVLEEFRQDRWDSHFSEGEPARMRRMVGAWKFDSWKLDRQSRHPNSFWAAMGFETLELRLPPPNGPLRGKAWTVPHRFGILCFGAAPASVFVHRWRRRRRGHHSAFRCPACGYDTRATRHRCPECGLLQLTASSPTFALSSCEPRFRGGNSVLTPQVCTTEVPRTGSWPVRRFRCGCVAGVAGAGAGSVSPGSFAAAVRARYAAASPAFARR